MTTIYDVARAAGVSPASVSRVINDRGGLDPGTVARIRAVMDRLDFRPRWRALQRNRLLVFLPGYAGALASPYTAGVLAGVVERAMADGHSIAIRQYPADADAAMVRQIVRGEGASGVVVIIQQGGYGLPTGLGGNAIPYVVAGSMPDPAPAAQVAFDEEQGMAAATRFLLDHGHRRLGIVTCSRGDQCHALRHRLFREAVAAAPPAAVAVDLAVPGAGIEEGAAALDLLLAQPQRPTAVLVTNQTIALGLARAARARGLAIPGDLSLLAVESDQRLSFTEPPLTALAEPVYDLGRRAVEVLLTGGGEGLRIRLPMPLVVRSSVAAPAA